MPKKTGRELIAQNRKARHDYHIGDVYEAGLVLTGTEVKSLRLGRANITEAYAIVQDDEVWLRNAHIPEYAFGTMNNHAPRRSRKLLLNRREITRITKSLAESGRTLVPLALYFSGSNAKIEIAVATGKRDWDKRQAIAKRDADREARRALASRLKRRT